MLAILIFDDFLLYFHVVIFTPDLAHCWPDLSPFWPGLAPFWAGLAPFLAWFRSLLAWLGSFFRLIWLEFQAGMVSVFVLTRLACSLIVARRVLASIAFECDIILHPLSMEFQSLVDGLCWTSVLLFWYYAISFERIQIFLSSGFCFCFSVVLFSRIWHEATLL